MGSSICSTTKNGVTLPHEKEKTTVQLQTQKSSILAYIHQEGDATTSLADIRKIYKFDNKILGSGHFGTVRLASPYSSPNVKFAVKTIFKEKVKKDLHLLKRELEILKTLDHPNIVKFYETYQDDKFFHLVMEYCSGGELLERIVESGQLSETETAKILKKVFSAVKYLHERGICHRDLKPENFLFSHKGKDAEIKVIDFGLSKQQQLETEEQNINFKALKTVVGTALYVAPEVLKGKYDFRCDNWSLGVIAYVLLSGSPPFIGENNKQIFTKVARGEFSYKGPLWKPVSKIAKDFISKLICVDTEKRMTADQALNHAWLKAEVLKKDEPKLDPKIIQLLRGFRGVYSLKREAMKIIVNLCTENEIKNIREAFRFIDKDHSGMISVEELRKVMLELGFESSESELKSLVKSLTLNEDQEINYSEFIAATLDKKIYLNKEKIYGAWKHFDIEGKNEITAANLREAMARSGRKVQNEVLQQWIKEIDKKNNGKISFEDFYEMMKDEKVESLITEEAKIE